MNRTIPALKILFRKRSSIKSLFILFLLILVLVSQINFYFWDVRVFGVSSSRIEASSSRDTSRDPTHSPDKLSTGGKLSERQFYFETREAFRLRQQIQSKIMFGAGIKMASDVFTTREGYIEPFIDSLPILRDEIPNFLPTTCNDTQQNTSSTRVSVIINFNNELLSLLLRSVYSVLVAIPPHNLHEVILIDDASNLTSHQDLLEVEPLTKLFNIPVHYHRFESNEGLIYSRRFGCMHATGDALLVLDSHIEVKPGFLEPLLEVIDANPKAVAAPVFDFWDTHKDRYWSYDGAGLGFDKYLTWIQVSFPKDGRNFQTPGVMGGAFLARKAFMEEIDYFGRGMVGWGYENLELSLKTWFCGGEMVFVPCSRVLHFASKRVPMFHGDRKRPEHYMLNAAIVVKSLFSEEDFEDFDQALGVKKAVESCEDTIRANRERMISNRCTDRDFAWLRRTLMPQIESFDGETLIAHTPQIDNMCLAVVNDQKLILKPCDRPSPARDKLRLTIWGELRWFDRECLDWGYPEGLRFTGCHRSGGNQGTNYDRKSGMIYRGNHCLGRWEGAAEFEKGPCTQGNGFVVGSFTFRTVYRDKEL